LAIVAAGAVAVVTVAGSHGKLTGDPSALARVELPTGGGKIESVSVVTGPHADAVPVTIRNSRLWPVHSIPAGERLSIQVVLKRPGWISWAAGRTERLALDVTTPTAAPTAQYVTVTSGAPLEVSFTQPVVTLSYGTPGHMTSHPASGTTVTLPHTGLAGSMYISATARSWEFAKPTEINWFPAGAKASAISSPTPGTSITPNTPIRITFSKPVSTALGSTRPAVYPQTAGSWVETSSHTLVFQPSGYGYGFGAHVRIALPAGISLLGGTSSTGSTVGSWRVPPGSTLRLQQLLAQLGYLPLHFNYTGTPPAATTAAQMAAAVAPPAGTFSWRYASTPSALKQIWAPGSQGAMTRGAVLAFQNDNGIGADGDPGPLTWHTLINDAITGKGANQAGYTFVNVDEASQQLNLWHDGQTVLTTAVNTGVAKAPTAKGLFAVYEHIRSGTMSGTNVDGTHYHDPGVPWISYFNGGDALHGFTRAQYGFPQSLGCVEMPVGTAGRVWPYTPIGTLVNVF
jgi:hypothetical protein